ncbi:MAG: hypothetical protein G01um10148_295 [Parcubacteria group bacterium Gr01-1014_8]|nr:MAG: hypothetical protein G01um10148_295 [Parcubacteria group bacterium Gr01-1014_8]
MTKRLAVVAGGWHFPLGFYEAMSRQQIPEGWEVEFFCVSHRDPKHSKEEKEEILANLGWSHREALDRVLYKDFATIESMSALGWKYKEYPNTIGDWGMSNQWLGEHDYKGYEMFLFTHDDNLILTDKMLVEVLQDTKDWLVLSNSTGNSQRRLRQWLRLPKKLHLRGSFEFFRHEMLDKMGGKFDLSETTLTREGTVDTPGKFTALSDWGTTVFPLEKLIARENLQSRIHFLSQYYRMSKYCLEGERGFIHSTHFSNTAEEEKGLRSIAAGQKAA